MVGQRARHLLLSVIVTVWVAQFVARFFGFEPDPTVNTAFLIAAGAVFGVEAVRGSRNRNGGG